MCVCVCVCVCVCAFVCMCVKQGDFSDTTMPKQNSTKFEAEISCAYIGPETELKLKYIENYKTLKLTSCL